MAEPFSLVGRSSESDPQASARTRRQQQALRRWKFQGAVGRLGSTFRPSPLQTQLLCFTRAWRAESRGGICRGASSPYEIVPLPLQENPQARMHSRKGAGKREWIDTTGVARHAPVNLTSTAPILFVNVQYNDAVSRSRARRPSARSPTCTPGFRAGQWRACVSPARMMSCGICGCVQREKAVIRANQT